VAVAELPSGTVTFLFTDLEGSTRLWEQYPAAMRAALARHDDILRAAVEAHRGQVVKTTGDGVHAVFGAAHDAIGAAVEANRRLTEEPWEETGPLRVRTGIHTGEAERRASDYYGPALNRAARLMAAAHGGQIVISNSTREVLGEDLAEPGQLVDLGEHRLRDLSRPEHVFQVNSLDLPTEFPPLRSLDSFPGNLPAQLTSFIGRADERAALGSALGEGRLVTITGVGGVGKTRLAIQVAADVLPHFPDGAWLCELAAANDSEGMLQIVAATLAVQRRSGATLEESILESLRPTLLLLVLDNCEHLLRGVRQLADTALRTCPRLQILATSREGLGLAGEQVWPLQSLDVPTTTTLETVAMNESVLLFTERARAVRPGFILDATNAEAVTNICRQLDGIPLAIELGAARVVALTPADIAGRLGERFRLLGGGRHASIERHQTLRAAVDWSYSLLEDVERTVFARLAVFPATFDAAAAEAVVAGPGTDRWDVLDALTSLVAKSMLTAEEGADGEMRYQLLETMRQYAVERLADEDDTDRWRRHHAEHYAALTERIAAAIRGPDELVWRARLDVELDNLRSAVTWALDSANDEDAELALRIVAALSYETSFNRNVGVGIWANRAAERAERSNPARRTDVLGAAAYAALVWGDHERARTLAMAALRDGPAPGGWAPGLGYLTLGYSALATGSHDEVGAVMAEGRKALEAIGADEWTRVSFAWTTAAFGGVLGDPGARSLAEEAVTIARRIGNPSSIANSLHALGWSLAHDSPDEALAAFEEATSVLRIANDNLLTSALSMIARLRARAGDLDGALQALRDSVEYGDRIGDRPQFVSTVDCGVAILARYGQPELAAVWAGVVIDGPLAALNSFPAARAHGDRLLTRVQAELGDDAYRSAVEFGARMSYDELVPYLLGKLDRLIDDSDDLEAAVDPTTASGRRVDRGV
jgi:predicted ATPase/class 3 adenylate cyclase